MESVSPNSETKTSNEDSVMPDYPLCTAFCDAEVPTGEKLTVDLDYTKTSMFIPFFCEVTDLI